MRTKIIHEARSWIGTRFHHQGRVKKNSYSKGGCDCIGLIVGVAKELDIKCKGQNLSDLDNTSYSKTPDGESLKLALDNYLIPIPINLAAPADILLLYINKYPQHIAFMGNYAGNRFSLIHCYMQARGVVEHCLDNYWQSKIVAAYRIVD